MVPLATWKAEFGENELVSRPIKYPDARMVVPLKPLLSALSEAPEY